MSWWTLWCVARSFSEMKNLVPATGNMASKKPSVVSLLCGWPQLKRVPLLKVKTSSQGWLASSDYSVWVYKDVFHHQIRTTLKGHSSFKTLCAVGWNFRCDLNYKSLHCILTSAPTHACLLQFSATLVDSKNTPPKVSCMIVSISEAAFWGSQLMTGI